MTEAEKAERKIQIAGIKDLFKEGLTNSEIAERLSISESNVRQTLIMWRDRNP